MEHAIGRIGPLLSSLVSSVILWGGPRIAAVTNSPLFSSISEVIGTLLAVVTIFWMLSQIEAWYRKRKNSKK